MSYKKVELKCVYTAMKKEQPSLTIDEFIEIVREHSTLNLVDNDFKQHAVNMLLSTREVVKEKDEESKEPIQLGK